MYKALSVFLRSINSYLSKSLEKVIYKVEGKSVPFSYRFCFVSNVVIVIVTCDISPSHLQELIKFYCREVLEEELRDLYGVDSVWVTKESSITYTGGIVYCTSVNGYLIDGSDPVFIKI